MESKDTKMSKREAINEYVKCLEIQGNGKFFTKEELRRMKKSLSMAVNMLTSLPDEVDVHAMNIALALLVAYIAANGKSELEDKISQLSTIGTYIRYTIDSGTNPLSKVLDYMHGKKKECLTTGSTFHQTNDDIRVMLHEILTISKYI